MSTNEPAASVGEAKETTRTEAFSDGVLAIAITLLVLEIRAPHVAEGESLTTALLAQWPSYAAYVVSFLIIAVMWVNHHNLFRYISRVDNRFLFLNSLLLMFITFLNFPTILLADYILEPGSQQVAGLVYSGTLFFIAILFNSLWAYATRNHLIGSHVDPRITQAISGSYLFGPTLYFISIILVFINVWLSLLLHFALAIYFALTDSTRIGS